MTDGKPDVPGPRRRGGPQLVFDVVRTEELSPHLVRVHLGGPAFQEFVTAADPARFASTDKYVKLVFAKPELGLVPPYDMDALRETLAPEDLPTRRTYTVRSVDTEAQTIAIDFVVHGDEGIAGPWAAAAQPGDRLALSGPGGSYTPADDPSVIHLFIGDDSAIPAISAALDALADDARGSVLIEVDGVADQITVRKPDAIDVRWLHRLDAGSGITSVPGSKLVEAVGELVPIATPVDVFAHGEREAIKSIRGILQNDWGLERRSMSLSAYWAIGRAEDRFQAEKREPVGQIFAD